MAKKKKKKIKAGILKRKTVKQNRKKQQQQKKTPKTAKPTEKKLQLFLGKVAVYVFTPEIQAITIEEKKLNALFSQGKDIPDQILEWVDEKTKQEFIEAVQKIQKRLPANQKTEYAGFQYLIHFMQEEKGYPFYNHLIVVRYYQLLFQYNLIKKEINKENIYQVLEEYETEFSGKFSQYGAPTEEAPESVDFEELTNTKEPLSEIAELKKQVQEEIKNLAPENIDLVLEDTDIFFDDFCEQKKYTSKEKIQPQIFKKFIYYAKQNLNPTTEDIANMQKSLAQIACALQNLKIFDKEQMGLVKKFISSD